MLTGVNQFLERQRDGRGPSRERAETATHTYQIYRVKNTLNCITTRHRDKPPLSRGGWSWPNAVRRSPAVRPEPAPRQSQEPPASQPHLRTHLYPLVTAGDLR
jgi:hypothetical protein